MVLVDTSVWIDFLGPKPGASASRLDQIIADGTPFALAPVILQEVLQGAGSPKEFRRLRDNLMSQRILYPLDSIESYVAAAEIYARCRRAGITPRGSIDCLIAQIAIEHQASLLHQDADFDRIAGIIHDLRIYA